jgi:glutamate/aspartate transport system substrate-binding protein
MRHETRRMTIRVGFQRRTAPFSFSRSGGFFPAGYSVDLAMDVIRDLERLETEPLRFEAVEVTSSTREELLASGEIDIECGSTTITPRRLERFAFTRAIYETTQRIAVKSVGHQKSVTERRIVGIRGSSSHEAIISVPTARLGFTPRFVGVSSIGEALDAFREDDAIDAIVADDIILRSALSQSAIPEATLLEVPLGQERYGFMLRREDHALLRSVDGALGRILGSDRHIRSLKTWFADEPRDLGYSFAVDAPATSSHAPRGFEPSTVTTCSGGSLV